LPGITAAGLSAFAARHGLREPVAESGLALLVETKIYGRFGCMVTLESGRVQTVAYNFAE
jgi:hypothetical protein